MLFRSLFLAAAWWAAAVPAAQADVVQLKFQGVFSDVSWPTPLPGGIAAGNAFTLQVRYDTDAVLVSKVANAEGTGYRYRYQNDSLSISLSAPGFGPAAFSNDVVDGQPIILRDNFGLLPGDALGTPRYDGISFQMLDKFAGVDHGVDVDMSILLTLRTTDLGLLSITDDKLPVFAPGSLAGFSAQAFQICRSASRPDNVIDFSCPNGFVVGTLLTATAVPEPASAGLMLAGLLGLGGLARRRRTA